MDTLTRPQRIKLTLGLTQPDDKLVENVVAISKTRLKPKQGAPVLAIPAAASVCMREQASGKFDSVICDPNYLSTSGIRIDTTSIEDHLPQSYEHALENLEDP